MSNLDRILAQLDREGATEIAIASGRPIVLRVNGTFHNLMSTNLTLAQLVQIVSDTPLANLWPRAEGTGDMVDIDLGRPVRVQFIKHGDEVMLRILPQPVQTRA